DFVAQRRIADTIPPAIPSATRTNVDREGTSHFFSISCRAGNLPMAPPDPGSVTALLHRVRINPQDGVAVSQLYSRVQAELLRVAMARLRGQRPGFTLQAAELVDEAFLQLVRNEQFRADDRHHFVRVASGAMWHL